MTAAATSSSISVHSRYPDSNPPAVVVSNLPPSHLPSYTVCRCFTDASTEKMVDKHAHATISLRKIYFFSELSVGIFTVSWLL